jgi:hypothetical protein
MPNKLSFGNIQLDVALGAREARARREPQALFVLALAGDFTGRSSRGIREPNGERKIWRVDCDNFAQVFSRVPNSVSR